jgi:alpha-galactosidase
MSWRSTMASALLAGGPPMGWNSWNAFRCNVSEARSLCKMANRIVELGLDQVGYRYVNLDDC